MHNIKSPMLVSRKKDKGTIVMYACQRIQDGWSCCTWRNKKLKQVVTAPLDDVLNMVKLTYISILLMIFDRSPNQECNSISCRETEFYIVSWIIKAIHKVMCTSWIPILQSCSSSKFYRTVTRVISSWKRTTFQWVTWKQSSWSKKKKKKNSYIKWNACYDILHFWASKNVRAWLIASVRFLDVPWWACFWGKKCLNKTRARTSKIAKPEM